MSDWWEQPYAGGPMVSVAGFPRPLYPPDAAEHGKQPSVNGPDVEAYKRTVSRAGRWPWQAFSYEFSNGFSHGKSGNVIDTGVAGVQRQQHLDATGWIGKKTFNTLRSIRIPVGLNHAGEPAMDAYAVSLINEAYELFAGHEPEPEGSTLRQRALDRAIGEIGYVEGPNNDNKYGAWYGMNYQPYCAIGATWSYVNEGDSLSFVKGSRYSYVPYIVGDARANRYGLTTTDDPIPGDLVCYDWEGDTIYDHVGLFECWTDGTTGFNTVEFNTSSSTSGSQSNGGGVYRRNRNRYSQGTVFVRVKEPT